jgi:hypothetical protein
MEAAVSNRVVARNGIGRFRQQCSDAAENTIRDAVEEGAELSRSLAPVGHKKDPRTVKLKDSIESEVLSRTSGQWKSTARHALAIEKSAKPHPITGWVNFFWEREGRNWDGGPNMIQHPGNAAQPYLRPAYEIIMRRIMEIARRNYPGG